MKTGTQTAKTKLETPRILAPHTADETVKKNDLRLTAKQCSDIAGALYRGSPLALRKIQCWRPYICPFEKLIPYIWNKAHALDIGCGAGLLLGLAGGGGLEFKGSGFDVSPKAIAAARKMAELLNSKVMLNFDLTPLGAPWPDGTFDVVFLIDVLHHVSPKMQKEFFARVVSKVSPGAVLIYKDMCLRPWWRAQANRLHDLVMAREFIHYVPIEQVKQWAEELQMRVIAREDLTRYWYGHELLVLARSNDESSREKPAKLRSDVAPR